MRVHTWYHEKITLNPHYVFAWTTFPYSVYVLCMHETIKMCGTKHACTHMCKFKLTEYQVQNHIHLTFLEQMASLNKALCMAMLISKEYYIAKNF